MSAPTDPLQTSPDATRPPANGPDVVTVGPEPLVACVVLHFNRPQDTLACVSSLQVSTYPRLFVIVLDCGPDGGGLDAIRRDYSSVEIVSVTDNRGYAGNNNVGITRALARGADWVCLLNDDTVLAHDAVTRLVDAARRDPSIGIVGPTVYHADEPTVIQSAGGGMTPAWDSFHFGQNEEDRGQFAGPRDVAWISGCALMVRRDVVANVGLLDERFFLYWEETEWCLRAGRAGWRVQHVPAAHVWHKGVTRDYRPGPAVTYYSTRNHLLTLDALGAPLSARLAVWSVVIRTLASWTLRPKWRSQRDHRDAMWQGARDYLRGRFGPRVPTAEA